MEKLIFDIETAGLNPALDRIIVIGYKTDEQEIVILEGEEKEILERFFSLLAENSNMKLIGFANDFDISFIKVRSIIHKINPSTLNNHKVIDLRKVLVGEHRIQGRLGDYGKTLGISKHNDIDGSMIPSLWKAGDINTIKEYCKTDVEITYKLFERLNSLGMI